MTDTEKWDRRYMALAAHIASWSNHRGRKFGAVIAGPDHEIRSTGYNGFPRNVNDALDERYQKPEKYLWSLCAERNAVCNAARVGTPVKGCTMYISGLFPCAECAKVIIQSGLVELVCGEPDFEDKTYGQSFRVAVQMLKESGVVVRSYKEIPPET